MRVETGLNFEIFSQFSSNVTSHHHWINSTAIETTEKMASNSILILITFSNYGDKR